MHRSTAPRALLVPLLVPILVMGALAAAPATAQNVSPRTKEKYPRGTLFVSGFGSNAVHAFRAANGQPIGVIPGVPGAQSITLGPDGLLYVCAEAIDQVVRIDPDRLRLVDAFVFDDPATPGNETGGLHGPTAATFGPDGRLYVASFDTDSVLRYDGVTGAFEKVFVPSGAAGLNGPDAGMCFGPDGDLYVPSFYSDRVLRFHSNGGWAGPFIDFREGTLMDPRDLVFHDGSWYVASSGNNRILRYDRFGNFVERFANNSTPYSLAFHPDNENLYVVSLNLNNVRMLDGETGAFVRRIVPSGGGGLVQATFLYFYVP